MSKKKVGIWMDEGVSRRLDEMAERFEGQKGEIVSAAVDMFLRADPDAQRAALESVMQHKLNKFFGIPSIDLSDANRRCIERGELDSADMLRLVDEEGVTEAEKVKIAEAERSKRLASKKKTSKKQVKKKSSKSI